MNRCSQTGKHLHPNLSELIVCMFRQIDVYLTSHCHIGGLWSPVGLAIIFPLRHSTVIDAWIRGCDFLQLECEGVRCCTSCFDLSAFKFWPFSHDTLQTQRHDSGRWCACWYPLPDDRKLSFVAVHFTCQLQHVIFIHLYVILHLELEPTLCENIKTDRWHERNNRHKGVCFGGLFSWLTSGHDADTLRSRVLGPSLHKSTILASFLRPRSAWILSLVFYSDRL